MKKLSVISVVTACFLLILSTACSGTGKETHGTHRMPNGDLREETGSAAILPSFLDGQQKIVRQVYQLAAQNAELLEWIPCYCGCGESAGHRNNLNCFIHEIRDDETVVWDDHGTRCQVCLEIAVLSVQMERQGMPVQDIRQAIDDKYGEGYAAPTPTAVK